MPHRGEDELGQLLKSLDEIRRDLRRRIEAELATARTKLKWAQRALNTVDNVNDTVSDLQDAARDALTDDSSGYRPSDPAATGDSSASATGASPDQPGDAKA